MGANCHGRSCPYNRTLGIGTSSEQRFVDEAFRHARRVEASRSCLCMIVIFGREVSVVAVEGRAWPSGTRWQSWPSGMVAYMMTLRLETWNLNLDPVPAPWKEDVRNESVIGAVASAIGPSGSSQLSCLVQLSATIFFFTTRVVL